MTFVLNTEKPFWECVTLIIIIIIIIIKIAASNGNIECFREYFAVGYRAPDPSFF
jgi:hypothetical protein